MSIFFLTINHLKFTLKYFCNNYFQAEKTKKKKKSSKASENIRERAEYMEAAGVSTPSNPNAGGSPMVRENGSASNESSVARLCTNSDLVVVVS